MAPRHTVEPGVLGDRGYPRARHPLPLESQHVENVRAPLERLVHGGEYGQVEDTFVRRQERPGCHEGNLHPCLQEAWYDATRHPAVQYVAHDGDASILESVEAAERLAEGVEIEEGLRRVLAAAVAGVDECRRGVAGS